MNNQFDELTKSMAQSVTRRATLKKFGVGLAGMALACLGWRTKRRRKPFACRPDPVAKTTATAVAADVFAPEASIIRFTA